jgi:hypothetical protein
MPELCDYPYHADGLPVRIITEYKPHQIMRLGFDLVETCESCIAAGVKGAPKSQMEAAHLVGRKRFGNHYLSSYMTYIMSSKIKQEELARTTPGFSTTLMMLCSSGYYFVRRRIDTPFITPQEGLFPIKKARRLSRARA